MSRAGTPAGIQKMGPWDGPGEGELKAQAVRHPPGYSPSHKRMSAAGIIGGPEGLHGPYKAVLVPRDKEVKLRPVAGLTIFCN